MSPRIFLPAVAFLLACAFISSAMDDTVLKGRGVRTKPLLGAMYDLELHVPESLLGADADTLIDADQPMAFVLTIQSRLINRKRFVEATSEGFDQAARSGHATSHQQAFLDQFNHAEFRRDDQVIMRYQDGILTSIYRKPNPTAKDSPAFNDTPLGALPGLDLKQALFAIWLGEFPVQDSLKADLLKSP